MNTPAMRYDGSTAAAAIHEKLDAICRRQQARFLDHLRNTGQATPRLESDIIRFIGFTFSDVKIAVRENSPEATHDHAAKQ